MSIAVVTIPRSGSMNYINSLSTQISYTPFPHPVFPVPGDDPRLIINDDICLSRFKYLQTDNRKMVYKITDRYWKYWSHVFDIHDLLSYSEEVHFLIRKDFTSQLKSYYAIIESQDKYEVFDEFDEPYEIILDEVKVNFLSEQLQKRYRDTAELYHSLEHPNKKLVYYEDFATPEKRYKRNFIWDKEPKHIDFHPEKLFTDK